MRKIRTSLVFVAALAAFSLSAMGTARAESKAWTAAKAVAPSDAFLVIGANIATIKKTTIYQSIVPMLLSQEKDAKEGIEMVKTVCSIDVEVAVTDLAVVVQEDEKALIVAALSGVDNDKLVACLNKIAEKEGKKKKLTAKTSGKITEYTMEGEKDKLYVAWLAKDVLALTSDPEDKALLEKFIGGKGLKGDVASAVGKVNTGAAVWCAAAKKAPVGKSGTMKYAYGSLDAAAGVLSLDVRIILQSSKEAKAAVDETNKEMAKSSGQLPPEMAKIMKSLKIAASGDEMSIKLSMTEKEAMSLVGMLMMGGM